MAMKISDSFLQGRSSRWHFQDIISTRVTTDLCIHLQPVPDRCVVVRRVSRRRGNTCRQRQVVPGWCSATSRRLWLNDLSETELTECLWESTRYVDTCAQPRHARPVLSSSSCTAHVVRLYIQHIVRQDNYKSSSGRIRTYTECPLCQITYVQCTGWAKLNGASLFFCL